jgi:hypothetical protein
MPAIHIKAAAPVSMPVHSGLTYKNSGSSER